MRCLILSLFMVLIPLSVQGAPSTKTISIANTHWPPYFSEEQPQYGMASSIISAAFKRTGYLTEFNTRPWARMILELKHGKYDAAATAYFTEDRAKEYLFSNPYMASEVLIYKRNGEPIKWQQLEDLKPFTIGTVLENAYSPEFDAANYLDKDAATTELINIRKLIAGRIDLLVMDSYVFQHLIKELPDDQGKVEPLSPPLYRNNLHVMFSRQSQDVDDKIEAFNRGLEAIKKDGTVDRIVTQYLSPQIAPEHD